MRRLEILVWLVGSTLLSFGLAEAIPASTSPHQSETWDDVQTQGPGTELEVVFKDRAIAWVDAGPSRKQLLFPSGIVRGALTEVNDDHLSLEIDSEESRGTSGQEVTIDRNRIEAIYRITMNARDPLWNGLLIGGGIGAGTFAIGNFQKISDIEGPDERNAWVVTLIGGGAGLGLLVDYLNRGAARTLVYQAPPDSGF